MLANFPINQATLYEIKQLSGGLDDTLVAGITATGLAGLANETKTPEIMRHARQQYALALRAINRALGSPIEALKDSTLLGVLILAIFETSAGSKQRWFLFIALSLFEFLLTDNI